MKRRNISEELKINDDVAIDNGEDNKPEEEKEANELEKAVQKDIDDKHKLVDEIRDAEAPKATANDGLGKSLNIKQFVEKLTLEETSDDVLNEDFNDLIFDKRSEAVHEIFDALENYVDVLTATDYDIIDECENVCYEALSKLEDVLDEVKSGEY